uniref:Uncharacterized protein n=1 Tax=Globodera rostochiensis TaxID=31243 RepID=A0A914H7X0_GLORO
MLLIICIINVIESVFIWPSPNFDAVNGAAIPSKMQRTKRMSSYGCLNCLDRCPSGGWKCDVMCLIPCG